jgi:ribosomal protein S18 acetylase RimI-like enzyme
MRIEQIEDCDKAQYMDMLLLADEEESMIDKYLGRGTLFALYDEELKAVCVVTDEGAGTYELKNIAVKPDCRRMGYGKKLIAFALNRYRERGRQMLVGTGDTLAMMKFYQSCGFSYSHTVRNFFTDHYQKPIIEDGITLADMVYLRQSL